MSHSLRVKIKGLRYKGIITDKDCNRLCKALDNEDVLDKIRDEIKKERDLINKGVNISADDFKAGMSYALQIIDKYREEQE